jgi:hypothetical protein
MRHLQANYICPLSASSGRTKTCRAIVFVSERTTNIVDAYVRDRAVLPNQCAQDNANRKQRNENATSSNRKKTQSERPKSVHVPCNCSNETYPNRQRKNDPFKDRAHVGTKHHPGEQASEADVVHVLYD